MTTAARFNRHAQTGVMLAALVIVTGAGVPLAASENALELQWAFVAFRQTASGWETYAVEKDSTLRSGDAFKFYLHPRRPCAVYLIHLSSQKELSVLHSPQLGGDAPLPEPSEPVFVPAGTHWFKFDQVTGKEKFYLLAAVERLADLETLLIRHAAEKGAAGRRQVADAVQAEIRALRKKHRKSKHRTEKPAVILGQLRDATPPRRPSNDQVAGLAGIIAADTFYGRTFTIDHQ